MNPRAASMSRLRRTFIASFDSWPMRGTAVLLISSELPEVLAHSDRIGRFWEGRLVKTLNGDEATAVSIAAEALPTVHHAALGAAAAPKAAIGLDHSPMRDSSSPP